MNSTTGRLDKETHARIFTGTIFPRSDIHSTAQQTKDCKVEALALNTL
jgi:hypothetical protein